MRETERGVKGVKNVTSYHVMNTDYWMCFIYVIQIMWPTDVILFVKISETMFWNFLYKFTTLLYLQIKGLLVLYMLLIDAKSCPSVRPSTLSLPLDWGPSFKLIWVRVAKKNIYIKQKNNLT